jgi:hypothetical protein
MPEKMTTGSQRVSRVPLGCLAAKGSSQEARRHENQTAGAHRPCTLAAAAPASATVINDPDEPAVLDGDIEWAGVSRQFVSGTGWLYAISGTPVRDW